MGTKIQEEVPATQELVQAVQVGYWRAATWAARPVKAALAQEVGRWDLSWELMAQADTE